MELYNYRNNTIQTLSKLIREPFACFTSVSGLPQELLTGSGAVIPIMADSAASVYVRIMARPGFSNGKVLDDFFQHQMNFQPGKDYRRHANGVRGGAFYFDFYHPRAIEKLTSYAQSHAEVTPQRHAPDRANGPQK